MKIIVTHTSPDWDAIGSVWLLRKYLSGWESAAVQFVPAGQRLAKSIGHSAESKDDPIEVINSDEVVHVDTGLGPLDHHQTSDKNVSGTSLTWEYVQSQMTEQIARMDQEKWRDRKEAIDRIVRFIVDTDHFKEVFWPDPAADYHEFGLLGLLDGLKLYKPEQDDYYVELGITCLEAMLHAFENRIWAEREIKEHAKAFDTRWGKALAFETINDSVLKLSQKMGYMLVVRKDPRKGYVRIKARPTDESQMANGKSQIVDIDLTLAYEKLSKIDPDATWFLHASKKMLLNGTPKNPKMVPTKLTLDEIVEVLKTI